MPAPIMITSFILLCTKYYCLVKLAIHPAFVAHLYNYHLYPNIFYRHRTQYQSYPSMSLPVLDASVNQCHMGFRQATELPTLHTTAQVFRVRLHRKSSPPFQRWRIAICLETCCSPDSLSLSNRGDVVQVIQILFLNV